MEIAQNSKLFDSKRWGLDEFRDQIDSLAVEASKEFLSERTQILIKSLADEVNSKFLERLKNSLTKIETEFWMNLRMGYVRIMKDQEERFIAHLNGKILE